MSYYVLENEQRYISLINLNVTFLLDKVYLFKVLLLIMCVYIFIEITL